MRGSHVDLRTEHHTRAVRLRWATNSPTSGLGVRRWRTKSTRKWMVTNDEWHFPRPSGFSLLMVGFHPGLTWALNLP